MFSDIDKAEHLNKYFASICNSDEHITNVPYLPRRTDSVLNYVHVTEKDISDVIKSLKLNKSSGPDRISHKLLKYVADTVSLPLCVLFNMSLARGIFPARWKEAHVMPFYKKGDKALTSNYRPISLLSCIGKLFERVVLKYISNHLLSTIV